MSRSAVAGAVGLFLKKYIPPVVIVPLKLDPSSIGPGVTLSNSDRTASLLGTGNARGLAPKTTGKWQFEVTRYDDVELYAMFGFAKVGTANTGFPGSHATSWGLWNRDGKLYNNGVGAAYASSGYGYGDVLGCVIDLDADTAQFYKNGVALGLITGITGTIVPMLGNGGGGGSGLTMTLQNTITYPVAGAQQWDNVAEYPAATYRYWRIWITANNGDAYTAIREIELRAVAGGPDVTNPSMTVTQSSYYPYATGPNYGYRVIDNDVLVAGDPAINNWVTQTAVTPPHWVAIDLGTAQSVVELSLLPQPGQPNRSPKDFTVQGSTDGTTWVDVKSFTGVTGWVDGTAKVFSISPAMLWFDTFNVDGMTNYNQTADSTATWTMGDGGANAGGGLQSILYPTSVVKANARVGVNMLDAYDAGLALRVNGNTHYLLTISSGAYSPAPQVARIYKRIAGTYTALTGSIPITWPAGTNKYVEFVVDGDLLTATLDGSLIASLNDSSITAAGYVGMRHAGSGGYANIFKDLRIDDAAFVATGTVFNPSASGAGVTLSAANTIAECANAGSARLVVGRNSGVWQFCFRVNANPGPSAMLGFAETSVSSSGYPGSHVNSVGLWTANGNRYKNNISTAYGSSYTVGDYIDCVINFAAGTAEFFKNGVSFGTFAHGLSGDIVPMVGNGNNALSPAIVYAVQTSSPYPQPGATQW